MINRRGFITFIASAVIAKSLLAKTTSVMAEGIHELTFHDSFDGFEVGDVLLCVGKVFRCAAINESRTAITIVPA